MQTETSISINFLVHIPFLRKPRDVWIVSCNTLQLLGKKVISRDKWDNLVVKYSFVFSKRRIHFFRVSK